MMFRLPPLRETTLLKALVLIDMLLFPSPNISALRTEARRLLTRLKQEDIRLVYDLLSSDHLEGNHHYPSMDVLRMDFGYAMQRIINEH